MSDWLVNLIEIQDFVDHPNADTLSITQVMGQNVIFKKGIYNKGDLAVFIPPDSILPKDPTHPLLKDNPHLKPGHRVDAVRLRGIFSNGFMVPAKILFTEEELKDIPVGTHVAERIGITKYEDQGEVLATKGENEKDHSYMPVYTDIEGWPKWRKGGYLDNLEIVVNEKVHGCVNFDTPITKADGNYSKIKDISIGDILLGVDEYGKVVPSKVINTFDNGLTDKWLQIVGREVTNKSDLPRKFGRFFTLICTPNHRVFSNGFYVPASTLKVEDIVFSVNSENALIKVRVDEITEVVTELSESCEASRRYDLETETHNYFANGILIHNCNARFTFKENRLWVGSRTCIKAPYVVDGEERNLWWKVAKELDLESKFVNLLSKKYNPEDIVIYGEVYGQVQDLRYGVDKGAKFRVFDTYSHSLGRYNDWDVTKDIAQVMGLDLVPELYRGIWNPSLEELRNGPSVLYPGHTREGFVVKPVKEEYVQFDPSLRKKNINNDDGLNQEHNKGHFFTGRKVWKFVGENYKTRKKK